MATKLTTAAVLKYVAKGERREISDTTPGLVLGDPAIRGEVVGDAVPPARWPAGQADAGPPR